MPERQPRGIRIRDDDASSCVEGTYPVECYCTNCDWEGEVQVPRGTPVPWDEPLERLARCAQCGCFTLLRYPQTELVEPPEPEEPETSEDATQPLDTHEAEELLRRMMEELAEQQRRNPVSPISPAPTPVPATPTTPAPWSPYRPVPGDWRPAPYTPSPSDVFPYQPGWSVDQTRFWMSNSGSPQAQMTTEKAATAITQNIHSAMNLASYSAR